MSRTVRFWLQATVSTVLIAWLFSRLESGDALDVLGRANAVGLIALLLVFSADRIWMAWKWDLLLRSVGHMIGLSNAVKLYFVSSFLGLAVPLGGLGPDIVRFVQTREHGLKPEEVFGSIVVERLLGLISSLIMLLLSIVLFLVLLPDSRWTPVFTGLLAGVSVAVLAGLAIAFHPGVQTLLAAFIGLRKRTGAGRIGEYLDVLQRYATVRGALAIFLVLSIIEQLFAVVAFVIGAWMLELKLDWLPMLAVVPVASFLVRLPVSYAGLGVREGAYVALLGLFGVRYADALMISVALFGVYIVSLLPGAAWSLFELRSLRRAGGGQ